jgi:hypothetical protein
MHLSSVALAAAAACLRAVAAIEIDFVNQNDYDRVITFVPSPNNHNVPQLTVKKGQTATANIASPWHGNFYGQRQNADGSVLPADLYSHSNAIPNHAMNAGMLGEISMTGTDGQCWYDVSAIINPLDVDNIQRLYPKAGNGPIAGCSIPSTATKTTCTPDSEIYMVWSDDRCVKTTSEQNALVCELGRAGASSGSSGSSPSQSVAQAPTQTATPAAKSSAAQTTAAPSQPTVKPGQNFEQRPNDVTVTVFQTHTNLATQTVPATGAPTSMIKLANGQPVVAVRRRAHPRDVAV